MTLPSVKEQIERFGRSAKATESPGRETIDARDLKVLGTVGRSSFATHGDREFKLKGPARPEQIEQAPADAILVHQPVRAADGRTRVDVFLATVEPSGTFERLQRRKTYRPKERRPGPLDGLAELRTPADRVPVQLGRSVANVDHDIILGGLSKQPMMLWTDSRNAPATVRRLIELVNGEGGNLRRHNGHTLADWTHVRRHRALLVAAWPLVDAHLAGTPLRCAYEHADAPVADTLDPAGNPLCNACAGWTPDAA